MSRRTLESGIFTIKKLAKTRLERGGYSTDYSLRMKVT